MRPPPPLAVNQGATVSVQCRTASQIKGRLILTEANRPFWFSAIGIFAFLKSSLSSGRRSHDRNKLSVSRCPVRFQSCRRADKVFRRRPRRRRSCLARKPFPKHFYSSVQSLCKHRTSWAAFSLQAFHQAQHGDRLHALPVGDLMPRSFNTLAMRRDDR